MLFYIAIAICVPLIIALDGFIDIFYEGNIETSFLIALSFTLILFVFIIKQSTIMFVSAGGLYKETKHCAIVDTCVNLTLSLTLVHFIGISGVLFATAIAVFIAEYTLKAIAVHKHIFHNSSVTYFVKNIKFFILFVLDLLLGIYIHDQFVITNLGKWFLYFIPYTLINGLLVFVIFKILGETKFIGRFKYLFGRSK